MKEEFLRTVIRNGGSLAINIPKEIKQILKLEEGEIVKIIIEKRK